MKETAKINKNEQKKRKIRSLLYHDNAPNYRIAITTRNFLTKDLINYYSTLTPQARFYFMRFPNVPRFKNILKGNRFKNIDEHVGTI